MQSGKFGFLVAYRQSCITVIDVILVLFQVARIQALDNEFHVKIDIQQGRLNRIRIQGLQETITDVISRIYIIFREVDLEKRNQMESVLISKEVFFCSFV